MNKDTIKLKGRVRWIKRDSLTGEVIAKSAWKKNLIMFSTNRGLDLVLRRLSGDNTYTLNINYGDVGTGSTAVAITDTQLTTAVTRAALSNSNISGAVVALQFFFADSVLANGTYTEFGTFVDGSASINTGRIFNHILFSSSLVKASLQDVTIEVDFTIS